MSRATRTHECPGRQLMPLCQWPPLGLANPHMCLAEGCGPRNDVRHGVTQVFSRQEAEGSHIYSPYMAAPCRGWGPDP